MICLVTDRRRLANRLSLGTDGPQVLDVLVEIATDAVDAGVDIVQVRESDLPTCVLTDLVKRLVDGAHGKGSTIVVNDRLDVALAAGAHGVHLKEAPIAIDRIRSVAPAGFTVGQSCHSVDQARDSKADYVIVGTVFPTRSKPGVSLIGLAGLEAVARSTKTPVLGIGGIRLDHLSNVAAIGAAGIAAVDLFLPDSERRVPMRDIVSQARRAFDRGRILPDS
jgi:thiamine-phosphate diphosphorylase